MIGPDASAFGFAFGSSSRSATSRIFSSRSSRFCCVFADTSENCVVPPHSSGCRPSCASSALTRSRFASGQVDLVDGDDDRHVGRARVRDRLLRLRHDAVVGGDDEHRDVGDLRAAGAHGRERLVARRVEERDLAAVDVDLVRADVLRDPAGLGVDDRRVSRIASSSVVLPWSTWPMIVTTGGRVTSDSSGSSKASGSSSSSAACLIVHLALRARRRSARPLRR